MKRRDFVKASGAATALAAFPLAWRAHGGNDNSGDSTGHRQYYELRNYRLQNQTQQDLVDRFLSDAAIPAWNRLGIGPVGAFRELETSDGLNLYVLIPYPNLEALATVASRLAGDAEYRQAGAPYLQAPKSAPAYLRIDNSLMVAFEGMPKIEVPPATKEKKPRIFELRTYESHSESAGHKKVEMFNRGEIDIMRRVGLGPVFYGRMLIGRNLPNLTYMLWAENIEAHKEHWAAFGSDEAWKEMKIMPEYADTVSTISNRFLVPTAYSQI